MKKIVVSSDIFGTKCEINNKTYKLLQYEPLVIELESQNYELKLKSPLKKPNVINIDLINNDYYEIIKKNDVTVTEPRVRAFNEKEDISTNVSANFVITKKVFKNIYIDEIHKYWCIPKFSFFRGDFIARKTTFYKFSDIKGVELQADGEVISSTSSGGLGRAVAGGLLFGGLGAVVGATTGKKTTRYNNNSKYTINILLNKLNHPCEQIVIDNNRRIANEIYSAVKLMFIGINEKTENINNEAKNTNKEDKFEEIKKYKELLDLGIINEEEFDIKRKEILNIEKAGNNPEKKVEDIIEHKIENKIQGKEENINHKEDNVDKNKQNKEKDFITEIRTGKKDNEETEKKEKALDKEDIIINNDKDKNDRWKKWLIWTGLVMALFITSCFGFVVLSVLRGLAVKKESMKKTNVLYKFIEYTKFEKFYDILMGVILFVLGAAMLGENKTGIAIPYLLAATFCFETPYRKVLKNKLNIKDRIIIILRAIIPITFFVIGMIMMLATSTVTNNKSTINKPVESNLISNETKSVEEINTLDKEIKEEQPSNISFDKEDLNTNFIKACNDIGIDVSQIKNLKKLDNWMAGERYRFTYRQMGFTVYCNGDNTINSIDIGNYKPYLQGYEPISVDNFIIDTEVAYALESVTMEKVKQYLNYPKSADFAWLNWGYARCGDIYALSGSLTAENAFKIEKEIKFYAEYKVNNGTSSLVYLVIDGDKKVGKETQMKEFERVEIKQQVSESGTIVLTDGLCGTYGKKVKVGSYEYIWYHVPTGKYKVTSNVTWCNVFLDKNKTRKNADGFEESVNVKTLTFNAVGQQQELEIKEGQHILLTINAKVTLEKQN